MIKSNDAKRLHDTAADLLKSANGDVVAAAPKLADALLKDRLLATAIAADYLVRIAATLPVLSEQIPKEAKAKAAPVKDHSRRRKGAHRRAHKSGMPTPAQRAGAMRAEKHFTDKVFERRRRGGTWATLRLHELRAAADADIHQGVSFLQRGFEDVRDGFVCIAISKHAVAADPYVTVPEVVKPALFEKFYKEAEVKAAQALIDGSTRLERDLITRAEKAPAQIEAQVQ
jgi:hypothetical protein